MRVEDLKRILNGEGPAVPIGFGSRSVVGDSASESLVDDEGYDERSEQGGFVTPPSKRQSEGKNGNGVGAGVGEDGGPPVLNLPSNAMTDGQMRPTTSSSAATATKKNGHGDGHASVINGGDQYPPPPSRGGASMRTATSTKTRAERKRDVKALLDGIKIDEKERPGGRGEREDVLAGIEGPPY